MANGETAEQEIELVIEMKHSEFNTPRPQVTLRFPDGPTTTYRRCRAFMFRLAAAIEEQSSGGEWIVLVGDVFRAGHDMRVARVELELASGSESEAEAAIEALHRAVQEVR